jgi:hypothetical protein
MEIKGASKAEFFAGGRLLLLKNRKNKYYKQHNLLINQIKNQTT